MTQWERLNAELLKRHKSWASLAAHLDLKKQNVGNWKSRGIPAKYLRGCAEFVSKTHDWLDIGEEDVSTQNPYEPAQKFKENSTVAQSAQAQAATNSVASLDQALADLVAHLVQADATTRAAAGGLLLALAQQPENPAMLASLTALLRPAAFTQQSRRAA